MSDTNEKHTPLPKYFMIIAVLALLWNAMGVFNFFSQVLMGEDTIANMAAEKAAYFKNYPIWLKVVFGLAVFPGFLGAIGLLVKKEFATLGFLVSLIAVILQMGYTTFMLDSVGVLGTFLGGVLPFLVVLIAAALYYWSMKGIARGWLTE